jgi:hypothetical protein
MAGRSPEGRWRSAANERRRTSSPPGSVAQASRLRPPTGDPGLHHHTSCSPVLPTSRRTSSPHPARRRGRMRRKKAWKDWEGEARGCDRARGEARLPEPRPEGPSSPQRAQALRSAALDGRCRATTRTTRLPRPGQEGTQRTHAGSIPAGAVRPGGEGRDRVERRLGASFRNPRRNLARTGGFSPLQPRRAQAAAPERPRLVSTPPATTSEESA